MTDEEVYDAIYTLIQQRKDRLKRPLLIQPCELLYFLDVSLCDIKDHLNSLYQSRKIRVGKRLNDKYITLYEDTETGV